MHLPIIYFHTRRRRGGGRSNLSLSPRHTPTRSAPPPPPSSPLFVSGSFKEQVLSLCVSSMRRLPGDLISVLFSRWHCHITVSVKVQVVNLLLLSS